MQRCHNNKIAVSKYSKSTAAGISHEKETAGANLEELKKRGGGGGAGWLVRGWRGGYCDNAKKSGVYKDVYKELKLL